MCVSIHMHVCLHLYVLCTSMCVYIHTCVYRGYLDMCAHVETHTECLPLLLAILLLIIILLNLFHGDFLLVSDMILLLSQTSSALHPTIFNLPSL